MKRRGFFGFLAALPLLPAAAVDGDPGVVLNGLWHRDASEWRRRSRTFEAAELVRTFASTPTKLALEDEPAWMQIWRDIAEKYGVELLATPTSRPGLSAYDPDFRLYEDAAGQVVLKIPRGVWESTPLEICEGGSVEALLTPDAPRDRVRT